MNKKKYHGTLRLLSSLLFTLLFAGLFTTCKAYSDTNGYPQLSSGDLDLICSSIKFEATSSQKSQLLTTVNNCLQINSLNFGGNGYNLWFAKGRAGSFCFGFSNGTFSNTLDYLYFGSSTSGEYPIQQATNYTAYMEVRNFDSWQYDNLNNKTGVNQTGLTFWVIQTSNFSTYSQLNDSRLLLQSVAYVSGDSNQFLFIDNFTVLLPTYVIYAYTTQGGRNTYFLSNFTDIGVTAPTPAPPSGEGSGDSPGGAGTVDLTETNDKIDGVKDAIDQQGEAIVAQLSGDKAEIIENQTQNTEAITGSIDNAFDPDTSKIDSGDIDLSTEDFEISPEDDPTSNFFTWLLEQIQDILTTDGDETLEFDFLDEHYILNSSDFSGPEGALKTFLVAYFTFAVGLLTALDIRKIIEQFKNGNIEAIACDDINANIV